MSPGVSAVFSSGAMAKVSRRVSQRYATGEATSYRDQRSFAAQIRRRCSAEQVVDSLYLALGKSMNIRSVPAIFLANGERYTGGKSRLELELAIQTLEDRLEVGPAGLFVKIVRECLDIHPVRSQHGGEFTERLFRGNSLNHGN